MAKKTRTSSSRRWLRRLVSLALVLFLTPVCAIIVTLYTQWGRDRLKDAAVQAIHDELGLEAQLSNVEVGVFPRPYVRAHDIVIDHPEHGRLIEARGLTIWPSIGAFISGTVDLQTIEIEEPKVYLIVRDGRIVNVPAVEGGSSSDELPFSRLLAFEAEVHVDAEPIASGMLHGVDLELGVDDGPSFEIDVEAEGGEVTHPMGTEVIERLRAKGEVRPDGADVDELVLLSPHIKVWAENAHIPIPFDNTYSGDARARVNLAHLANLPHGFELPPLAGTVEVDAHVEGHPEGAAGTGSVRLDDVVIDRHERGLGHVELALAFDPAGIRITEGVMRIIDDGGEAGITGTIGLGEGFPVDVDVDIRDFHFAQFMKQLGVTDDAIIQWRMTGAASLRGRLDPFRLEGPIRVRSTMTEVTAGAWHEARQEHILGVAPGTIRGRVTVDDQAFRFEHLRASTGRSNIHADVHLRFDDTIYVRGGGDIDLADVTPLVDFPLAGRGTGTVEIDGEYSNPNVRGHARFEDFAFNTFPVGTVESDWQLEKEGLAVRFPDVTAVKNESRFHVNDLFLDFSDDRFAIDANVVAQTFMLSDFYHAFHFEEDERFTPYQARFEGNAQIRFTLGYPGDSPSGTMIADLDLQVPEATLDGFAFTGGEFRGRWRWLHYEQGYRGGELAIERFHLRKGRGVLSVSGRMGLGGVLQATAMADRLELVDTEGVGDRVPQLQGVYSLFSTVTGTAESPHLDADVVLTGLSYGRSMLGDARLFVRMTDRDDPWVRAADRWDPANLPADEPCVAARSGFWRGRWRPDPPIRTVDGPVQDTNPSAFLVCGEALDGRARIDMAIGRTSVYPLRGLLTLESFDLAPFLPDLEGVEGLHGELTGSIALDDGAVLSDESLGGRVRIQEIVVGQPGVEIRNEGEIDVLLRRGGFEVLRAVLTGPDSRVGISGGGTTQHGLALAVNGDVDLGIVGRLSPRFTHSEGRMTLHVSLSGGLDDPAVFGQAMVRGGSFRYAGFPEPVEDLTGLITFSSRRVLFEDFTARIAGGELSVSGSAAIRGAGIDRYEFDVDARDVSFRPMDGLELSMNADGRLSWAQGQRLPLLAGTLELRRLVYERDIELSQTFDELSRRRRADVESYDPNEDRLEIDLRVVEDAPIRIANNLIDADVRIEDSERPFRIVGTDQRPGAIGTLFLPRGVVHFRNTDFDIRRGVIEFDDTYSFEPSFDVTGVTEIRRSADLTSPNWRITLHAHGTTDAFRLDTSSEPELSEEDIVLLLTVGMTRAEADQLQAGNLTSTAALEALTAVTGLDREVREAVQVIDSFAVTSRYSPRTGRAEPHVSVGRRITDRVRLTASTSLSESRDVRASVEWRLDDQTSVQVSYDNENQSTSAGIGNLGADFHWRLEFE
jgi:translocation and assembly module TamB